MSLEKKKELAKRTFDVGKGRIVFIESRLDDIKEAITKQDIRDLQKDGAIIIKPIGGRKKNVKRGRRGVGKIRKRNIIRKRGYVNLTRKLRKYLLTLGENEKLSKNVLKDIKKKIRNKAFRSKEHLKEHLREIKSEKSIGGGLNENAKKKKKRK